MQGGERLTFHLPKATSTSPFGVDLAYLGTGTPVWVITFNNPDGVAATSGLQVNDIVLTINGVTPTDDRHGTELLKQADAGTVVVEVVRPPVAAPGAEPVPMAEPVMMAELVTSSMNPDDPSVPMAMAVPVATA